MKMKLFVLTAVLVGFCAMSFGETIPNMWWDGGDISGDPNWVLAANWDTDVVPTTTDQVGIRGMTSDGALVISIAAGETAYGSKVSVGFSDVNATYNADVTLNLTGDAQVEIAELNIGGGHYNGNWQSDPASPGMGQSSGTNICNFYDTSQATSANMWSVGSIKSKARNNATSILNYHDDCDVKIKKSGADGENGASTYFYGNANVELRDDLNYGNNGWGATYNMGFYSTGITVTVNDDFKTGGDGLGDGGGNGLGNTYNTDIFGGTIVVVDKWDKLLRTDPATSGSHNYTRLGTNDPNGDLGLDPNGLVGGDATVSCKRFTKVWAPGDDSFLAMNAGGRWIITGDVRASIQALKDSTNLTDSKPVLRTEYVGDGDNSDDAASYLPEPGAGEFYTVVYSYDACANITTVELGIGPFCGIAPAADIDGDCDVDGGDLSALSAGWLTDGWEI